MPILSRNFNESFIIDGHIMKHHILIVDNESPARELLAEFFKKHGYQVISAATAEEATRLADETPQQLVILAIALVDADGLELLRWFKQKHPALPVIMLTRMGFDEELLQEALQSGASGYVSKGLPLRQMLMEVHRVLNYFK